MRHDVLVYQSYFYDQNIKDHDRVWRTKERSFRELLNTIYEIFDFSETAVFSWEAFCQNLIKIEILVTSCVMKSRHF